MSYSDGKEHHDDDEVFEVYDGDESVKAKPLVRLFFSTFQLLAETRLLDLILVICISRLFSMRFFKRKETTIVMAFRQCFFFDTPYVTKIFPTKFYEILRRQIVPFGIRNWTITVVLSSA